MPDLFTDNPRRRGPKGVAGAEVGSNIPAMEGRQPDNTISSKELETLSGATYRQIDYWCQQGYIHPVGNDNPGSGQRRRFNPDLVDKVKLIVKISKAFERPNSPLGYIFEHYEDGEFDMGEGVYLTWDVVEIEREVN